MLVSYIVYHVLSMMQSEKNYECVWKKWIDYLTTIIYHNQIKISAIYINIMLDYLTHEKESKVSKLI